MDEKEILQRQVDALEKLLQIKEAIIQEQESRIDKLQSSQFNPNLSTDGAYYPPYTGPQYPQHQPSIPSVWAAPICPSDPMLGPHTFGGPNSITSHCTKCGMQSPWSSQITYANDTNASGV